MLTGDRITEHAEDEINITLLSSLSRVQVKVYPEKNQAFSLILKVVGSYFRQS